MHGAIKVVTPPAEASVGMRANAFIQGLRDTIDLRIRSVLPGDVGSIASALITGKRDAITPRVYDAMFVSGIGHVLSISGYHMAVVAGVVFFIIRALLALIPGPADHRMPIKKWAAFAALLVTAFYLGSFRRRSSDAAVVHYDRDRTRRCDARSAGADATLGDDRRLAGSVVCAASGQETRPSFQMSFAANVALRRGLRAGLAVGAGGEGFLRLAPVRRCGASTR